MQHDGNIANQLFPATRTDINAFLESILSSSLGAAAPAVTFAGQWFYNETDDILYIRDKDNATWIPVGLVSGGEFTPYLGGDELVQGTDAIVGIWEAATGAEAAALTSATLVLTPLALASVLATEALFGLSRLATIAEVQAGSATNRAAHPDGIASLWQQGAAIASATTLVKPADASLGRHYSLTGAVTVAALWAGEVQGREVVLTCAGAPTFTHSANLDLPGAANYTAAAGDVLIFKAGVSPAWKCIGISKYSGLPVVAPSVTVQQKILHIQDLKASGTAGGTFTSGAWRTHTLTTKIVDEIGSTLSGNQFTLPAGDFWVEARQVGYACNSHRCRIRNVSDSDTVAVGPQADGSTAAIVIPSTCSGGFSLAAEKTFELQGRCTTTRTTDGFGQATSWDEDEVYADVKVTQFVAV